MVPNPAPLNPPLHQPSLKIAANKRTLNRRKSAVSAECLFAFDAKQQLHVLELDRIRTEGYFHITFLSVDKTLLGISSQRAQTFGQQRRRRRPSLIRVVVLSPGCVVKEPLARNCTYNA